jgi:hypothetical protein
VSDATAASKDRNNPIFCAVLDATAASNTENPRSSKQTIRAPLAAKHALPNLINMLNLTILGQVSLS